jgi:DnaK suppressor protein
MSDRTVVPQLEIRLLQEIDRVQAHLQLIDRCCAQDSNGQGDIADRASHTVDLANNLALRALYEHGLRQLERARTRLRSGLYGVCELCGEQIDPARLEVLVHATLCASCQRQSEKRTDRSGRRVKVCSRDWEQH